MGIFNPGGTVTIQDGGNTITVGGTVSIDQTTPGTTNNVTVSSIPAVTGTVTIQDGGNTITVDGEITTDPLATWVSGSLTLTNATTAYLIPASEQAGRRQLILYNGSDTNMFIGSSAVAVATGILLATGATMMIDAGAGLYAICASAGKVLNYLEGK